MTTTLITGGAGFIGSHLVDHCLSEGGRILVIDDLSTGRLDNLDQHRGNANLEIVTESLVANSILDDYVKRCNRVFHLAAAVGVRRLNEAPDRVLCSNLNSTVAVLQSCARHQRPVLIASSSEVYGKSRALPQQEDAELIYGPPTEVRWAYACSKAAGEFLAQAYHRRQGLPVVTARFFNTVGPRQSGQYGMVVPRFINQALAGQPITVYGDGLQTRCFCHVTDIVRAAAKLMDTSTAYGEIVNLGSDDQVTIESLAELVKEMTGSASEIVTVPFEQAYGPDLKDMRDRKPDISKARALIDFQPTMGLRDILADTIEYQRQAREIA